MRPSPSFQSVQFTPQQQALVAGMVDYRSIQSLPEIWPIAAQKFGSTVAVRDPHAQPEVVLTYGELYSRIQQFAAGLQSSGVVAGDRVALFSDDGPRWLIADQGIMMAGAINAVRSSQADPDELLYILENSESTTLVVEDIRTFQKLGDRLPQLPLKLIVLLSDEDPDSLAAGWRGDDSVAANAPRTLNFHQLMEQGSRASLRPVMQTPDTTATLIYTSGTSGQPKGVMLSHNNLMHQVTTLGTIVQPKMGDRVLGILPTWHSFGRTGCYFLLSQGCTQIYTNIRYIKNDFKQFKPHYMLGVPRIWESIYEGAQKQFRSQPEGKQNLVNFFFKNSQKYVTARRIFKGLDIEREGTDQITRLMAGLRALIRWPIHLLGQQLVYKKVRAATGGEIKQIISGGGSLAKHLEMFYEIIGVSILVGYGLTETAPVLSARIPRRNQRGASGPPVPGTEFRIVDLETQQPLPQGQKGLVQARGPQIMQGYYRNPEATAKAIDPEGWFDTGDLGWLTRDGNIVLTGRAKDTIVLTNGENIEPLPIEDACTRSAYIDQMMLVGQDQKTLGALIVPNLEALEQWAQSQGLGLNLAQLQPADLEQPAVQDLFRQELNREVKDRPGYRPDDRIGPFRFILEPFSVENGRMTQTLKIRRPIVTAHYQAMIDEMFS